MSDYGYTSTEDVVGIFDNDTFDQLFPTARAMKATVTRIKKAFQHPIETGFVNTDGMIDVPAEVDLAVMITGEDYASTYQQILDYYTNCTFLCVQTRADVFFDMLIVSMPHEETPEIYDVVPVAIKLRETFLFAGQYQALPAASVEKPQDQSTVNRGAQQPQSSALYQAGSAIKGLF